MPSFVMWRRVAVVITDTAEERIASIIRVTGISELRTTLAVTSRLNSTAKISITVQNTKFFSVLKRRDCVYFRSICVSPSVDFHIEFLQLLIVYQHLAFCCVFLELLTSPLHAEEAGVAQPY
jgi:hypothetical protein